MSRRDAINIKEIIDIYKRDKDIENSLKKSNEERGKSIKEYFKNNNITNFKTDKYEASVTTKDNESLNEELAIEIIKKKLGGALLASVIKTKEYIDEDALEKLVYNGDFDIKVLNKAKIIKTTQTLRVIERKE